LQHRDRGSGRPDHGGRKPPRCRAAEQLGARRVPGHEAGGGGGAREVDEFADEARGVHRQGAEQRGKQQRVERRVVDGRGRAREIGLDEALPVGQGEGQAGVKAVVVKHAHEIMVQRERADE